MGEVEKQPQAMWLPLAKLMPIPNENTASRPRISHRAAKRNLGINRRMKAHETSCQAIHNGIRKQVVF